VTRSQPSGTRVGDVGDHDDTALFDERFGDRLADTGRAACDERNLALKPSGAGRHLFLPRYSIARLTQA
jgi:hypothetical protein